MATLTLAYPDALQATLTRALALYGARVIDEVITGWLKDRARLFAEQDAKDLKAACDQLTDAEKAAIPSPIRVKLGL